MSNTVKVGSLVFSTQQGLGILAKALYDHGIITHPLIVAHGKREEHDWWFPNAPKAYSPREICEKGQALCRSVNVMLFLETPFDWQLIPYAQQRGVKTVLLVNHECMPHPLPFVPDLILCPSLLDLDCYSYSYLSGAPFPYLEKSIQVVYLPVPVDTSMVQWRQRTTANVFVHNAGWGGLKGRNGTAELLEALRYVQSPASFIIRSQEHLQSSTSELTNALQGKSISESGGLKWYNSFVYFEIDTFSQEEMWGEGSEGDVFVFPEKFNGLSLPLQEARAAGMLVMSTNRYPMNRWLPNEPLISCVATRKNRVAARCREFDEAIVEPRAIAAKIDEYYGRDISNYSKDGQQWASVYSWESMGPEYHKLLRELVK